MALRPPDWNNKWFTKFGTIQQRNLSGQPRYKDRPVELIIDGFDMTISLVSRNDLNSFIASYLADAGNQSTYTDFEGTVWTGYWSPELKITRGRKISVACGEDFKINIRFEGTHA